MEKKGKVILVILIILLSAILSVYLYCHIKYNEMAPPEKWPIVRGSLEVEKIDNTTNSIVLKINIERTVNVDKDKIPICYPENQSLVQLYVRSNHSDINPSNYTWEYLDINEDGLINSGDKLVIYLEKQDFDDPPIDVSMQITGCITDITIRGVQYEDG